MEILEIIFWTCFFAVFYAYLGYPACLWLLALVKSVPVRKRNIRPCVSLVISVYNEERILARKIENTLSLDYPEDLLEVAIISDGSTDKTNSIIREYAERNRKILPCIMPMNKGKTACLNHFVPKLRGEIILFSDANAFYDRDLILKLVSAFADEKVGFVTGSTRYFSSLQAEGIEVTSLYSRLEDLIKALESRIASCVGADGAVFAIRKSLFSPMKAYDINDFVIPLMIVQKGHRGILEQKAFCHEEAAEMQGEFRRQVRITTRTLRAIFSYKTLLNPFRYPFLSFEIISHKLMKFMTPFWMLLILITNLLLASEGHFFYKVTLILQILFYILALTRFSQKVNSVKCRVIDVLYVYLLVNTAYVIAWIKYLTGETYISWSPERK